VTSDPVERHLERQIEAFGFMRSHLYEHTLEHALADYRAHGVMYRFFEEDPARKAMSTPGVRLMAAFHFLALTGEAPDIAPLLPSCGGPATEWDALWEAIRARLESDGARIGELFAQTPQTNEVLRATVLTAGLLTFARGWNLPLRLFEIGASAGLNTRIESDDFVVAERAACDLHPLDVNNEHDCTRLLAYIWADDWERVALLRQAIERARKQPLVVEQADMFEWLKRRVAPKAGYATVVMQSVVADHLTKDERARLSGIIETIGEKATPNGPFGWLRMEFHPDSRRYQTRLTTWPGGFDDLIATSTGHARDIEWIA
jgi:hypothetical protein